MDLQRQGQNLFGFSELVYFPDHNYQVQQFLCDQGVNEEIEEVEISDTVDLTSAVFQLTDSGSSNRTTSRNGNQSDDQVCVGNEVVTYHPSNNVEIEGLSTDYIPTFDDFVDSTPFEYVGNHVSVAYESNENLLATADPSDELNGNGKRIEFDTSRYEGNSNFEIPEIPECGRKRKLLPDETSDDDDEQIETDCENSECGQTNEHRENEVVSQLSSSISIPNNTVTPVTRGRRDYKKYRFIIGLRAIVSKIGILKIRTGAVGLFKAVYENEEYNQDNALLVPQTRKKKVKSPSACEEELDGCSNSTSENSSINREPDHSYSATILTQKESSQTVHDHQYNDDTKGIKDKSRDMKKHYFVKGNYQRQTTLLNLMKALFTKKKEIEAVTGAWIELTVDYEEYNFTQDNIVEAESMLRKRRCTRQVITPMLQSTAVSDENPITNPSKGKHEIIIKAPKSSYRFNQTNKIVNSYGTTMKVSVVQVPGMKMGPCFQFLDTEAAAARPNENSSIFPGTPALSSQVHKNSSAQPFSTDQTHYYSDRMNVVTDELENDGFSGFPSSPADSVGGLGGRYSSPLPSPAVTESMFASVSTQSHEANLPNCKTTQDFGTNTETICAKCFSHHPDVNANHTQNQQIFWVRCFDPLCHHIVHASCLGFYVNSYPQLKMLPPYFCEKHRS